MPNLSFNSWIKRRDHRPQADQIVPMVAQTGTRGMSRGQIGGAIDLDRDVLDALLDGLVRFGLLTVRLEDGVRVLSGDRLLNRPAAGTSHFRPISLGSPEGSLVKTRFVLSHRQS